MKRRVVRKSEESGSSGGAPFASYIRAAESILAVLSTEHGFTGPEVDVRIPACVLTYKRTSLWVRVTFEYPGIPFCTLRIEREDGSMQWVGFDAAAKQLGLAVWSTPSSGPSIDTAAEVVESNLGALVALVEAIGEPDAREKLHEQLWRLYS